MRATVWQRDQNDNRIKTDKDPYTFSFQISQKTHIASFTFFSDKNTLPLDFFITRSAKKNSAKMDPRDEKGWETLF